MSITIKRGDTHPPLVITLSDANGPIDLTAAEEVRLILKSTTRTVETDPVDITDAENGIVTYEWDEGGGGEAGDTDESGTYRLEAEILWAAGRVQTVPNDGYGEVVILDDLGGLRPVAP